MRRWAIVFAAALAAGAAGCSGEPARKGHLVVRPEGPIELGAVEVGEHVTRRVMLANDGTESIPLARFEPVGDLGGRFEIDAPVGVKIPQGGAIEIVLGFEAERPGGGTLRVDVFTDTAGEATLSFDVVAAGEAPPRDGGVVAEERDAGELPPRDGGVVPPRDAGPRDAGPPDSGEPPCFATEWTAGPFPATDSSTVSIEEPQIAYGDGVWTAVWTSRENPGGAYGPDRDIFFSRSTDGVTWGPRAVVEDRMRGDSVDDFAPRLATDGLGNWVVTWLTVRPFGQDLVNLRVARWSNSGDPEWFDVQIVFSSTEGNDDAAPRIAADGDGRWMLVWHAHEGDGVGGSGDIAFAVSTDRGETWTEGRALNDNAAGNTGWDAQPALVASAPDVFVVAWTSGDSLGGTIGDDHDVLWARTTDGGATWSPATPLFTVAGSDGIDDNHAFLVADGRGRVSAFLRADDPDQTLLHAGSEDHGATWSLPDFLGEGAEWDARPVAFTDGFGRWSVLMHTHWMLGGDGDIVSSWSEDDGLTWSALAGVDPNAGNEGRDDYDPSVATDKSGRSIALWVTDVPGPNVVTMATSSCGD